MRDVRTKFYSQTQQNGSKIDVKVNRFGTLRWTEQVIGIIEHESVQFEYIEGDYLGTCEYTFQSVDGRTKLGMNLTVRPKFLIRFILFLVPKTVSSMHSDSLQLGLKKLNDYLTKKLS